MYDSYRPRMLDSYGPRYRSHHATDSRHHIDREGMDFEHVEAALSRPSLSREEVPVRTSAKGCGPRRTARSRSPPPLPFEPYRAKTCHNGKTSPFERLPVELQSMVLTHTGIVRKGGPLRLELRKNHDLVIMTRLWKCCRYCPF